MAARISTFSEPEVRTVLEWDPKSCKNAELSADSGELASAADLCERIFADDRVEGVMLQRASIARLPLNFEGGSASAVKRLRDEGEFWRICPLAELGTFHRWYAMLGVGVGRFVWTDDKGKARRRDGQNAPIVQAWSSPRHLSRGLTSGGWECTISTGQSVPVAGGIDGWLLWQRPGTRPWVSGAWRACRLWWLLKQYAIQDWARYSERHGQGTWVLKPGENTDLGTQEARSSLVREFKALGRDAVTILRYGWDSKLIESTANNYQTFSKQIEAADSGQAIALLGQNLTSEVKGGSFAAAKVHATVSSGIIANDAEAMSDFAHDQVLVPWAIANYGSADAAPWPVWDTTPPDDSSARVKTWVDLSTALKAFRAMKVPVDIVAACESVGLPLEAGAKVPTSEDMNDDDATVDSGASGTSAADGGGSEVDEEELADGDEDEDPES